MADGGFGKVRIEIAELGLLAPLIFFAATLKLYVVPPTKSVLVKSVY
jgi:hypothetical protein